MAAKTENNSPAALTDRDFFISRVFAAPRDLLFSIWTEPKHLSRWWGPKGFTNSVCEFDPRPGGAYRLTMQAPDGTEYPIKGVIREFVRPERLVMTMDVSGHPDSWHDRVNPQRKKGENAAGEFVQTVTFEDLGDKTKVSIRTRFETAAIRDGMVGLGMTEGWNSSLDRLGDLVAEVASAARQGSPGTA